MAEFIGLSPDTARTLQHIIRDYKSGRLKNPAQTPQQPKRQPPLMKMGKVVTAPIAAGAFGSVQIQKGDWTDSTRAPVQAENNYGVELPVGTKVLVLPVTGKWRIVVPFNLECP